MICAPWAVPFADLPSLPELLARLSPYLPQPIASSDEFCGLGAVVMQDQGPSTLAFVTALAAGGSGAVGSWSRFSTLRPSFSGAPVGSYPFSRAVAVHVS